MVGALDEVRLLGVGGFARFAGDKLDHKGLVWGMYVRPEARGRGVADAFDAGAHRARTGLRVPPAADGHGGQCEGRAFYERQGFRLYGIEPRAVRQGDDLRDEALMWLPLSGE